MTVLGIDAGTTRFKTAILTTSGEPQTLTNRLGETFTPSVVYFSDDGSILVGTEAANAALAEPERSVFDWKINMGNDDVLISANGKDYTAKDILQILLETVKQDAEAKLGEPINEAVITVPANYTNIQKKQTENAAQKGGLKILVTPHEPTAGALGNKVYKISRGTVLVFDLGGGTFDVSVIEVKGNVSSVIATGGIPKLGGRDINHRVEEQILSEFKDQYGYRPDSSEHAVFYQDLKARVEQLKISLSAQNKCSIVLSCSGDVLNMTVPRNQFESWIVDLIEQTIDKTKDTLSEAGLDWGDIDAIYPIGGGSMMPIVINSLEETSGKKVTQNCEAHCAAALGAAVAGRLEYDRQGKVYTVGAVKLPPANFDIKDILSRAVGVLALDENNHQICCEVLSKDTPIPSVHMRNFQMSQLDQTDVQIQILQGREGDRAADCDAMGHFDLNDLPARPDVINRIEVSFDIDKNGMLTASARDTVSNKKAELEIDYNTKKAS